MKLSLPAKTLKLIDARVKSGKYRSAEDVVSAAISQLDQHEQRGDFQAGELDRLLAEGEKSGPPLDGDAVLKELRNLGRKKKAG